MFQTQIYNYFIIYPLHTTKLFYYIICAELLYYFEAKLSSATWEWYNKTDNVSVT